MIEGCWGAQKQWINASISAVHVDGRYDLSYLHEEQWTEEHVVGLCHVEVPVAEEMPSPQSEEPGHMHGGQHHKGHHKHRHAWKKAPAEMQVSKSAKHDFNIGESVKAFSNARHDFFFGTVIDNTGGYEVEFESSKTWIEKNVEPMRIRTPIKLEKDWRVEVLVGKPRGKSNSEGLWFSGVLQESKGGGKWVVNLDECQLSKVSDTRLLVAPNARKWKLSDLGLSDTAKAILQPDQLAPSSLQLIAKRNTEKARLVVERQAAEMERRRRRRGQQSGSASAPRCALGEGDYILEENSWQPDVGDRIVNVEDDMEDGEKPVDKKEANRESGSKHDRLQHKGREGRAKAHKDHAEKQNERMRDARLREQKRTKNRDAKRIVVRADSQSFCVGGD